MMTKRLFIALWAAVVCVLAVGPVRAQQGAGSLPEALADWQTWVLRGEEYRRCPFLAAQDPQDANAFRCTWPERLVLTVDARGGTFTQSWQVFAESWLRLPGSTDDWPRDVRVDGAPAAVVLRDGAPQMRLAPGRYTIAGTFSWTTRPEALPLAPQTALVELTVDGARVAQPERPNGAVWLGKRRSAEQPAAMEVQVYRLVRDELPVELETRVRLQVAGEPREELLARVLPEGFTPLSLASQLAARLEPDGRLRVQVRPGAFEISLRARGVGAAAELARPKQEGLWAREEIWSFQGNDRLRVAGPEGAEGIDPVQANVPAEWQALSAYRMAPETVLRVVERSRGLANVDENRLSLRRQLWLDFDHGGFTAVDAITGSMRKDWRLDMQVPFRLESARQAGQPLLVTEGAGTDFVGVELRAPQLSLDTIARTQATRATLPATGWASRFESASGVLHLPPGHRLLAAPGTDAAPGSWLDNWGLWNLFGVLIVVVFTYWVAGRVPAAIALAALLLTYQEQPSFVWLWGNLLAAIAIARAAPEGRFRRFASGYRTASFASLALALLPFMWWQIRVALYPQLETGRAFAPAATMAMPAAVPAPEPEVRTMEAPIMEAPVDKSMDTVESASERALNAPSAMQADGYASGGGLNAQQAIQRYAPGTLLQAGPGIPAWQYNSYSYSWSGPVEPSQSVRFVFIGPVALLLWRFAGVVALAALFLLLARASYNLALRLPKITPTARGSAASVVSIIAAAAFVAIPDARAASTPDPALLEQLKARLVAPPRCVPTCAEVVSADVRVAGERLDVTLKTSALANVAVAMPHANDRWQLDEVSIDGRSALAVGREGDASLWIPLEPGARTVRLSGRLAAAESVQLVFPQPPRTVAVTASGWAVAGVSEGRLTAGSLELTRERAATGITAQALEAATEFPSFVRVERTFNLDLDWSLATTVARVAPERAPINVIVPLVAGESVLTEGLEIRNAREALVALERDQALYRWDSGLARSESLALALEQSPGRAEVWRFLVNPQWRVNFEGMPAVMPENVDAGVWSFVFYPRPSESLKLAIARPKPAAGSTLAIDSVYHNVTVGKRSSDVSLAFGYRSTQGGRHTIAIPPEARVTQVTLDGAPVQLRPENGELSIALLPGEHQVALAWQENIGAAFTVRPSAVDLRAPASNVTTTVALPQDRWPLFAYGSGVGPAFLYWGELIVFVLTAWLLGRWSYSPLKFHEWLLLGLGLSTLSWWVFAAMAVWFFAMRWRERWDGGAATLRTTGPLTAHFRFNIVQVLLAGLTVIAVSALVFSGVRYGLLASPDMGVVGPGSGGNQFSWFNDQTESLAPRPTILAVPLWVYRTLMFAWALWIAVALVRWLNWAFAAWTSQGFWRGKVAESPAGT
jgi:hypothetical protein